MDYPKSVPNVGLVNGKFVDENAATGVVGSLIPSAWGNGITDELLAVIQSAQITPDEANHSQLLAALRTIVGGMAGTARGVKMTVGAASASATLTADEVTVKTSLGGQAWLIPNFNKAINLANTGIGGMDAGLAPASGSVAIYAIYNPTNGASALLAVDASSVKAPEVYGGAAMPAGYTASALVSVRRTNASRQFLVGNQVDRTVTMQEFILISTTAIPPNPSSATSAAIPINAKSIGGNMAISSTTAGSLQMTVAGSAANDGKSANSGTVVAGAVQQVPYADLFLLTPQTFFYTMQTSGSGTSTASLTMTQYTF